MSGVFVGIQILYHGNKNPLFFYTSKMIGKFPFQLRHTTTKKSGQTETLFFSFCFLWFLMVQTPSNANKEGRWHGMQEELRNMVRGIAQSFGKSSSGGSKGDPG